MEDARVLEKAAATDPTDDLTDDLTDGRTGGRTDAIGDDLTGDLTGERRASGGCPPSVELVPMPRPEAERIARALKAVAEPTRLQLLSMIQASADGEACVCDLTAPLGLTQPTVSHHLKTLVDAGLITREKRGIWVWYAIVPDRLDAIRGLLG